MTDHLDMISVIAPRSDQINADDLISGDLTVTISDVQIKGGEEQPVSIKLEGMDRVYRPCKSMSRVLVQAWGADAKQYAGKSLTLYRDPKVKWGGMEVGGIRIRAMSHIERELSLVLAESRAKRTPYRVKVIQSAAPAQRQTETSPEKAQEEARAIAKKGTEAFRAWWGSDEGKACREACKPIMQELQSYCKQADESAVTQDPFEPTPEDLARAEQEAQEAIERGWAEGKDAAE